MDVFQGVAAIEIVEDFKRHDEKGFVPVAEFTDTAGAVSTARRLVETLQLADDPNVTGNFEIALAELAENVIFHSGEDYGVASAQHWRRRDTVEMAIVDTGRGIPAGLRQNPAHLGSPMQKRSGTRSSCSSVGSRIPPAARGSGSHRNTWNGTQAGLRSTQEATSSAQAGADRRVVRTDSPWPGTIVWLQLSPSRPLDITDVYDRYFPPDDDFGLPDL